MKKIIILIMMLLTFTACSKVDVDPNTAKDTGVESDNLAFYVKFHVKPEYVEQWKAEAMGVIDKMSKEDTFVACYMHQDSEDPTKFTLYEVWSEPSMDAFIKNQLEAKEYRLEYEKTLPEKLQSERTFQVLNTLQEWHK